VIRKCTASCCTLRFPQVPPTLRRGAQPQAALRLGRRAFETGLPIDAARFSAVYPHSLSGSVPPRKFRQVEYVDVLVFPLRYDLTSRQAIFTSSLSFTLQFDRAPGTESGRTRISPG